MQLQGTWLELIIVLFVVAWLTKWMINALQGGNTHIDNSQHNSNNRIETHVHDYSKKLIIERTYSIHLNQSDDNRRLTVNPQHDNRYFNQRMRQSADDPLLPQNPEPKRFRVVSNENKQLTQNQKRQKAKRLQQIQQQIEMTNRKA